jgi:hypothetical protein
MTPSLVGYLWLVVGPSRWMCAIGALVIGFAVYLVWLGGARQVDQVAAIAMFLQLFAASTGYRGQLRAGHFDPILVQRPGPWRLAAVHWSISVGLGLAVWTTLGIIALVAGSSQTPMALTPAGISMIVYISTVSWAIGLAAGRSSGAIAWLALLLALIGAQQFAALRVGFVARPESVRDWFWTLRSALVVPPFLLIDPQAVSLPVAGSVLAAAAAAWLGGAALIRAFDATLERS